MQVERRWLNSYPSDIPGHLDYDSKPLFAYLESAAEEKRDHTAVHFLGKRLTFGELYDSSLRFADSLSKLGVKKGDRVAIMLPNCPQGVIA
jgi:long-chain acyl-CoA synthetase